MMRWWLCLTVALALCSCRGGRHGLLPTSSGKPYEVLLVGDRDSLVYAALDTDAEGLPQPEPSFDISVTDEAHFNRSVWSARNIIKVSVDSAQYTVTRIRYDKDVYAEPQLVVYVNTPSAEDLRRQMPRLAPQLRQLLARGETNREISRLQTAHNPQMERMVEGAIGWTMSVPGTMTAWKKDTAFMWMSDRSATAMRCLCVYTLPLRPLTRQSLIAGRDSVMSRNIPGELPGMAMHTVEASVAAGLTQEKGRPVAVVRGLWEMSGDAMGGPFVAHVLTDTVQRRLVVAEAFVYAPGMSKRNTLRQTEAALYTLAPAAHRNKK